MRAPKNIWSQNRCPCIRERAYLKVSRKLGAPNRGCPSHMRDVSRFVPVPMEHPWCKESAASPKVISCMLIWDEPSGVWDWRVSSSIPTAQLRALLASIRFQQGPPGCGKTTTITSMLKASSSFPTPEHRAPVSVIDLWSEASTLPKCLDVRSANDSDNVAELWVNSSAHPH